MDLTFLKWPFIIALVVLAGWLLSNGGVNYMYGNFIDDPVGVSAEKDAANESGLSRLGGYCLRLFKYDKAMVIFQTALERYPEGNHRWYNQYRMAKCAEKMGNPAQAVSLLQVLIAANASQFDNRVPTNENLQLRVEKLIEVNDLRMP